MNAGTEPGIIRPDFPGASLKIAIPTDDGVFLATSPSRASAFIIAEVALGEVIRVERRLHRPRPHVPRRMRRDAWRTRYSALADAIRDCQALITSSAGSTFRRLLNRRGLDVVVTSEPLVDRAIALFACISLPDESDDAPAYAGVRKISDLPDETPPFPDDEFDA